MSRAIRRHHRKRLMKKRKNYWGYPQRWIRTVGEPVFKGMSQAQLSKVSRTPNPCSCWMCCNPRWVEGPTIQERRTLDVGLVGTLPG